MKVNQRLSNIELLRCFLMFLIVVQHFIAHNILSKDNPVGIGEDNFVIANLMLSFCVCAVNCFVLISGYFGITFSIKKLVLFLLPILCYEVIISLLWYPYRNHISVTPFNYWFVRPYVALMIISPLLNLGIEMVGKKKLLILISLLILIFILPITSLSGNAGKNILIFVILYMTGRYIRLYYKSRLKWGVFYRVCAVLAVCVL